MSPCDQCPTSTQRDSEFSGRSDYEAFVLAGIPSGGLFTGAEVLKTEEEVALFGGLAGVAYLVKTQLSDGTWLVKSRSKPFQTYFESGFPHGKDQFISIAGSCWATTALILAARPEREPRTTVEPANPSSAAKD